MSALLEILLLQYCGCRNLFAQVVFCIFLRHTEFKRLPTQPKYQVRITCLFTGISDRINMRFHGQDRHLEYKHHPLHYHDYFVFFRFLEICCLFFFGPEGDSERGRFTMFGGDRDGGTASGTTRTLRVTGTVKSRKTDCAARPRKARRPDGQRVRRSLSARARPPRWCGRAPRSRRRTR